MLAIIYSDWYYGVGKLYKQDGTPYRTQHGAFRNHPCTQWAAANQYNLAWLILHGIALCDEYYQRYGKVHTCYDVICQAQHIYHDCFDDDLSQASHKVAQFTRAMPESIKFDTTIDTITAYKQYLNTKPWLATNYLRIPSRKPSFITTMTQTPNKSELPIYDFSTTPEQRAEEQAKMDAAIQVAQLEASLKKQEAPVVKSMKAKAKGIVPTKKATPKATKKAGRVVGISADENKFLYELLQAVLYDNNYATMISDSQIAFDKLIARYNNK
tara:strand:- start:196 stop:1005 length:810 start_codon:yes stop_codon:yes gene_type:complete